MQRILTSFIILILAASASALSEYQLAVSGYVHSPLQLGEDLSLEAEAAAKEVLAEQTLYSPASSRQWISRGDNELTLSDDGCAVMAVNLATEGKRARGSENDPDYALYGHAGIELPLAGISLSDYNRVAVDIVPDCPGCRVITMTLGFINATVGGEGYNAPTGDHMLVLENGRTNRCYLEIADFRRDAMQALRLNFSINGRDMTTADSVSFKITGVVAQRIAAPERVSGWQPQAGKIIHSMTGYDASGRKTAIISTEHFKKGADFRLVDAATGATVFTGRIAQAATTIGEFGVLDFSEFGRPGEYRLDAGEISTPTFRISGSSMWDDSCWKVLNFIFCMRCGYAVPGVHSMCHIDLNCSHEGKLYPYMGGWHDAGDLSQQTMQTGDVVFSLLELCEARRKSNPALAARLQEEALWGLEFILRTRLGGGWHASSMGLLIWQDGIHGSHDDISTVRKQDVAFDNYLYAAYEAYAARVIDCDPALAEHLAKVAAEDYRYAEEKFARDGFGGWISPYEHTFNTSESQHMATASWAASQLYQLTGDESYARDAVRYADYVLRCRCDTPVGGLSGFFYRNPSKRSVVHFIHQSREQIYMQALVELCKSQPQHEKCSEWRTAVSDYGKYLKNLMKYTSPYGMLAAGIYRDDEYTDTEAFYALHLFPPQDAPAQFTAQSNHGIRVAPGYFVKRFPIWFNIYSGNLPVHISMGKSAGICGNFLHDDELLDIAREQLYWTVGKNPFAQSLIYGEGSRYPELNNFSSGRIVGAMPVGIRTLADTDEPYWPQINNACYKEVWLTSAGKWLSLIAEV